MKPKLVESEDKKHKRYIEGIRNTLVNLENHADEVSGITESGWVAIRASHRLLKEYLELLEKQGEHIGSNPSNLKPLSMKVYISGKMRGMTEEESRRKFKEAEFHLKALGYEVVHPWDTEQEKKKHCKEWCDYILFDLKILSECDSIYMLDNWQDSWGAKCEHAYAWGRGMNVMYQKQGFRSIPSELMNPVYEQLRPLVFELAEHNLPNSKFRINFEVGTVTIEF